MSFPRQFIMMISPRRGQQANVHIYTCIALNAHCTCTHITHIHWNRSGRGKRRTQTRATYLKFFEHKCWINAYMDITIHFTWPVWIYAHLWWVPFYFILLLALLTLLYAFFYIHFSFTNKCTTKGGFFLNKHFCRLLHLFFLKKKNTISHFMGNNRYKFIQFVWNVFLIGLIEKFDHHYTHIMWRIWRHNATI